MEAAIKIGNEANPEAASYIAGAIVEIFKAGFESHQSEAVMLKALSVVQSASSAPSNISLNNCNFEDKIISQ